MKINKQKRKKLSAEQLETVKIKDFFDRIVRRRFDFSSTTTSAEIFTSLCGRSRSILRPPKKLLFWHI